jgi:hypothetical protein
MYSSQLEDFFTEGDTEVRILVAIHLIATDTTRTNGSLLN